MTANEEEKNKLKKEPIRHRLLTDEVTDVLRQKIIEGTFAQGFRLVEEELSEAFGVSRALIREAAMQLESEGLVARNGRRREVASFCKTDYEEIYMLRFYIEKLAIAECLDKNTLPAAALLKKAEFITRLVEKKPIDFAKLTDADLAFHELLIEAAGNSRALRIWQGLKNQIKTLLLLYFRTASVLPSTGDHANHVRLVKALEARDAAQIDALLEAHILSGLDSLLQQ